MALDAVAFLLFLLPVPGWVATVILLSVALRAPRIPALTERAIAAVVLSGAASAAAYLASNRLGLRQIDQDTAVGLLVLICLAVSLPSVVWLVKFIRGDFGR